MNCLMKARRVYMKHINITVRVTETMNHFLEQLCEKTERSKAETIRILLDSEIEKRGFSYFEGGV